MSEMIATTERLFVGMRNFCAALDRAAEATTALRGAMEGIDGIQVVTSPHLPVTRTYQFRFPKSKKERIRKKWRARPANYRTEEINAVMFPGLDEVMRGVWGGDLEIVADPYGPRGSADIKITTFSMGGVDIERVGRFGHVES